MNDQPEAPALNDTAAPRPSRARLFSVLPRLSSTALALRNRFYTSPPNLLSDERVLVWQDGGPFRTVGELVCRIPGAALTVAADGLSRIEPRLEGFESFVPTETCTALVEHALSPVLTLLERIVGVPIECDQFRRGGAGRPAVEDLQVGFVVFEPDARPLVRGWVRTTPEAWAAMDLSRGVPIDTQRRKSVPVRLSIRLAAARVTALDLQRLKVGDAIRTGQFARSGDDALPVMLQDPSGAFRLPAVALGDQLTLESPLTTSADTHSATAHALDGPLSGGPDAPDADPLSEIECDLTFELGAIRLTVAEVARMRPGQVMRLGVRLQEKPVRLLVNGRMLARGELAVVGDELVVVVTDTGRLPAL